MVRVINLLIFITILLVFPIATFAQDYPAKAITIIDPLAPGGMLDLLGRTFGTVAEKSLGKPVVMLNKTGAAGAVGSLATAQAKPDGYTLGMGWSGQTSLIVGEILAGRKPSFTIDDFVVLGRFTNSSPIFLVPYNSPWKTIQQALDDIKAHPNTYSFSSAGIYQISHLPMEMLMSETNIKLRHVPFQGGGPALTALIGEHVNASALFPGVSVPKIRAKQMRALAQFGEKRQKNLEDVPTFKELGINVVYSSWMGLLAPKETPASIVEKLRKVVKEVASDTAFVNVIEKGGDQVDYADGETMGKLWQNEFNIIHKLMERLAREKK